MFKKLISNLPFNPSLIGEVSFYAKRLHREEKVRRAGFGLVIVAVLIQVFAVASPPQASLARAGNDIIPGGVSSQGEMVNHCKANNYGFATILDNFGIDCNALFFGKVRTISSRDYGGQLFSIGRVPYDKPQETPVNIPGLGTFYMRPLWSWDTSGSSNYKVVSGNRANGTPFMILFDCGNLVIVGKPTPSQPNNKELSCSKLTLSVKPNSRIEINTAITVKGRAKGKNLSSGEKIDMYYDVINVKTNKLMDSKIARGVPFNSDGYAEDSRAEPFKLAKTGHYRFRLAVGSVNATPGNLVGSCAKDVFVATTPTPDVAIECTKLISSFGNGQKVIAGSNVNVRGQATGNNLNADQKVNMRYDYVDSQGKVVDNQVAKDIKFNDDVAEDNVPRTFKLEQPGTYTFRLAVTYDGDKPANGNQTGNCSKQVIVDKPCDQSNNNNGAECLILSKKARNDTQKVDNADGTIAHAGDTIVYTLSTQNSGKNETVKGYVIQENLIDIMQYADIINLSGGTKDEQGIVSWPAVDIKPGQTINTTFTIRIKNPIPSTPVSTSDPGSFDMKLTNIYGNKVEIKLPSSLVKTTEYVAGQLPNTGPGETLIIAFSLTAFVGYFFMRSRLLAKEVDIVKDEFATTGGL